MDGYNALQNIEAQMASEEVKELMAQNIEAQMED